MILLKKLKFIVSWIWRAKIIDFMEEIESGKQRSEKILHAEEF